MNASFSRLLITAAAVIALPLAALNARAAIAPNVSHTTLNGLDVYTLPTGVRDVVTFVGSLPAGDAATRGGNAAIATLVGDMLDQGTTRQDKFAIAEKLESVGAELNFSVGNDSLNISGRCLRPDLPMVLDLLVEQLRAPSFNADDLDRVKTRLIGGLQRSMEDPGTLADQAFNNTIYSPDHPNFAVPIPEFIHAVQSASLTEIKAFHRTHYGPEGLILVLVGDVDPTTVNKSLSTTTTGWTGGSSIVRATLPANRSPDQKSVLDVNVPDKTSVNIVWGQATGLTYRDADSLPLSVGTAILGSGFTGRLLANVRDKEGLTYGIGARAGHNTYNDGDWTIGATFAPQLLDQGIASTRRQLEAWITNGVTAQELADRKTNLVGEYKLQLATTRGLAGTILRTVQRGEPLSDIDTYSARVEALTLDQVNGAIRKYLDPKKMVLVRAGTITTAN